MVKSWTFKSHLGFIKICACDCLVHSISFTKKIEISSKNLIHSKVESQLKQYFNKERFNFDLPLYIQGTKFQKKVWEQTSKVAFGKTTSYFEIARSIKNEKSFRAVGSALNKNPFIIVIPCHRVIAKNQKLSGYVAGDEIKKTLLDLEKGAQFE